MIFLRSLYRGEAMLLPGAHLVTVITYFFHERFLFRLALAVVFFRFLRLRSLPEIMVELSFLATPTFVGTTIPGKLDNIFRSVSAIIISSPSFV